MATLQSGKCFTVPTFFGMCCRSEWQERMYIYKWHEVDQTKHEIFCSYCLQWNTSQSKFRNHYFLFLFVFSILSQLFLIWGCNWYFNLNRFFDGIKGPSCFLFRFIHSQIKFTSRTYFQPEVCVVCGIFNFGRTKGEIVSFPELWVFSGMLVL